MARRSHFGKRAFSNTNRASLGGMYRKALSRSRGVDEDPVDVAVDAFLLDVDRAMKRVRSTAHNPAVAAGNVMDAVQAIHSKVLYQDASFFERLSSRDDGEDRLGIQKPSLILKDLEMFLDAENPYPHGEGVALGLAIDMLKERMRDPDADAQDLLSSLERAMSVVEQLKRGAEENDPGLEGNTL